MSSRQMEAIGEIFEKKKNKTKGKTKDFECLTTCWILLTVQYI